MSLTRDNLISERPHPSAYVGGVQRIYRVGNHGLSLVNGKMLHTYYFAWEAAVLRFMDGPADCAETDRWTMTYSTPLTKDVEVFESEEKASEFILQAFEWFKRNPVPLMKYSVVKGLRTKRRNRMRELTKELPGLLAEMRKPKP